MVIAATAITAAAAVTGARAIGAAEAAVATAITTTITAATAITVAATAIATTAAISTFAIATAVAAFAVTATVATAFIAIAAAKATRARRTGFHGTCFIDHQAATTQRLAVHALNSRLCFCFAAHFHKAEALGAAGVAFHHDTRTGDCTKLAECLLQVIVAHTIRKVADIQLIAH